MTVIASVVIPTLGRSSLSETVAALCAQSENNIEIIVVANGGQSAVERVELALHDLSDHRVEVIHQPIQGASAARNLGLEKASGEIVAFTDDDAVPDPRWIAEFVATFRRDERSDIAALTGRVLATDTQAQAAQWFEAAGVFDKGTSPRVWSVAGFDEAVRFGGQAEKSPFFPLSTGDIGASNNLAVRTAVLRLIGGFDLALGAGTLTRGGEDLDVLRRILMAGDAIAYVPSAVVYHHHRSTIPQLREQMFGYGSGMAAVLTKVAITEPAEVVRILKIVPIGVRHLLADNSAKNAPASGEMPRHIRWIEFAGYLAGPLLYLRSFLRYSNISKGAEKN